MGYRIYVSLPPFLCHANTADQLKKTQEELKNKETEVMHLRADLKESECAHVDLKEQLADTKGRLEKMQRSIELQSGDAERQHQERVDQLCQDNRKLEEELEAAKEKIHDHERRETEELRHTKRQLHLRDQQVAAIGKEALRLRSEAEAARKECEAAKSQLAAFLQRPVGANFVPPSTPGQTHTGGVSLLPTPLGAMKVPRPYLSPPYRSVHATPFSAHGTGPLPTQSIRRMIMPGSTLQTSPVGMSGQARGFVGQGGLSMEVVEDGSEREDGEAQSSSEDLQKKPGQNSSEVTETDVNVTIETISISTVEAPLEASLPHSTAMPSAVTLETPKRPQSKSLADSLPLTTQRSKTPNINVKEAETGKRKRDDTEVHERAALSPETNLTTKRRRLSTTDDVVEREGLLFSAARKRRQHPELPSQGMHDHTTTPKKQDTLQRGQEKAILPGNSQESGASTLSSGIPTSSLGLLKRKGTGTPLHMSSPRPRDLFSHIGTETSSPSITHPFPQGPLPQSSPTKSPNKQIHPMTPRRLNEKKPPTSSLSQLRKPLSPPGASHPPPPPPPQAEHKRKSSSESSDQWLQGLNALLNT